MYTITGKYTNALITIDNVEDSCVAQINTFVNHPAFTNPVAIMPDCHAGRGSCIGFCMKMSDKIIPAVTGVDIGCGMKSFNVGGTLPISLTELDHKIRQRVPFGMEVHEDSAVHMRNDFPWHAANVLAEKFSLFYSQEYGVSIEPPRYDMDWFVEKGKKIGGDLRRYINSIGTVGGNNHFVETGVDDKGDHWITVHTGSRNLGKRVCDYWQLKAEKKFRNENNTGMRTEINAVKERYKGDKSVDAQAEINAIKDKYNTPKYGIDIRGLEWLEGLEAAGYLLDMVFCQAYASFNRSTIQRIICDILKVEPIDAIETVHNFIDFQDFIIRKGAIRSYKGERSLIPFNMRDGILVCEGLSEKSWNCSAPHGAGRLFSRAAARQKLSVDKYRTDMDGIFSTSVGRETLDESPDAYKDPKSIENAIAPTAIVLNRIRPIHNMKDRLGTSSD